MFIEKKTCIDLNNVILEDITIGEFVSMEQYLKPGRSGRKKSVNHSYCQIVQPLWGTSYMGLIEEFMENPFAYRLAVNCNGKWIKKYKDEKKGRFQAITFKEIAEIAEENVWKSNYFEMVFKENPESLNRIIAGFTETSDAIVSYEITAHRNLLHLLGPQRVDEYMLGQTAFTVGLWVPEKYLKLKKEQKKVSEASFFSQN